MRLGVEAGLDLPKAIGLAAEAIGSPSLLRDSRVLVETLEHGRGLRSAGTLWVLPASVPTAMDPASDRGDLALTLDTLTQLYRQQAESRLGMVNAILAPMLLVGIGLVIGLLCIALFLPLIKMMSSVI